MAKKSKRSPSDSNPGEQQKYNTAPKAILALKDTLIKEGNSNRMQEGREDWWGKIIASATLFFVFCTTGGIFFQDYILHSSDSAFKISAAATKDAADAAKASADAVFNIERPYLFVQSHPSKNTPINGPYPAPDATPTIVYTVMNIGRAPAIIRSAYAECFVEDKLPQPPWYLATKMHQALNAIGPNATNTSFPPCKFDINITENDWVALKNKTKKFFFVTWLIYEGALDATYISGVAFQIDPFTGDAFPTTEPQYNYNRTVKGRMSEGTQIQMPYLAP